MTNKDVLMSLCKAGYTLQEIAAMTHRSVRNTWDTLRKMVEEPCRGSDQCLECSAQAACEADYARVMALKPIATRPRRGRYCY